MAVDTTTKPEGFVGEFDGDINANDNLPSRKDLEKVAELPVLDVNGKPHTFKSLYASVKNETSRVLFIFIRHFFCGVGSLLPTLPFHKVTDPSFDQNCQEYLRSLSTSITPDALQAFPTPTKIIVIGCGQPELIPMYTQETKCPYPIYADPSKKLYAQLGMIRTLNLGPKSPQYMQYSLPSAMVRSIYQALKAGRGAFKGGDYWQVGAEFLFENGHVTWCHRMKNTRDHAEVPEIRRQLGLDGAKPPSRKTFSSGIRRSSSQLQRRLSDRRMSWSRSRDRAEKSSPEGSMMEKLKEDKGGEEAGEQASKEEGQVKATLVAATGSVALAILGEASVESSARISALSKSFLLPRLIPAPQALIRASRPERLEPANAKVVGAYSGGQRDRVNYIAHLLHDGDSLRPYSVRCEKITKEDLPPVKAKSFGPTTLLAFLGCAMSIALLALSIHEQDGMALLATILLSLLSTLVGVGSQWTLVLSQRRATRPVPCSDVVINYPNGAFLVIKCGEEVARSLYWSPEECVYDRSPRWYRLISLLGTLMLMFGVICLGNAELNVQLGFAASYIILNAAYWVVAALPQRWNWDLRCYKTERQYYRQGEENDRFTTAMWKAIAISGTTKWVRLAGIAPVSEAWDKWLDKAAEVIEKEPCWQDEEGFHVLPDWDPEKYLDEVHGHKGELEKERFDSFGNSMV
ncbi:MAG: hypothetical protein Q9170_002960 [Blastenia crenularia]